MGGLIGLDSGKSWIGRFYFFLRACLECVLKQLGVAFCFVFLSLPVTVFGLLCSALLARGVVWPRERERVSDAR